MSKGELKLYIEKEKASIQINDLQPSYNEVDQDISLIDISPEELDAILGGGLFGKIFGGIIGGTIGALVGGVGIAGGFTIGSKLEDWIEDKWF